MGIDSDGRDAHAAALHRHALALVITGKAQHIADCVVAGHIGEIVLCNIFGPQGISGHENGFCDIAHLSGIMWCWHKNTSCQCLYCTFIVPQRCSFFHRKQHTKKPPGCSRRLLCGFIHQRRCCNCRQGCTAGSSHSRSPALPGSGNPHLPRYRSCFQRTQCARSIALQQHGHFVRKQLILGRLPVPPVRWHRGPVPGLPAPAPRSCTHCRRKPASRPAPRRTG